MRIGIDARMYSSKFTGIGRYVFELIKNLLEIDTVNKYVLFMNEPEFSENLGKLPEGRVKLVDADAPYYSIKEQLFFWRKINAEKLDLMHFTHFNAPILYRRSCIVTIHDLTLSLFPGNKKKDPLNRLAYNIVIRSILKRAKKIISVSKNTKNDIVRLFKIPKEKISVSYLGIAKIFHEIKDEKIRDDFLAKMNFKKPFLLYAGVWRSHKNLANLIKAFALIRNKYKIDCSLVITGKEDPWYPEVKETVARENLEGEVRFTGYVSEEDLVLLFNTAKLFVFPSLYEGFGLPPLEAFACGTPVAAARSSCLPEICGEENAEFFEPKNIEEMAEKIAALYKDENRQAEFIKKGFARVKEFSWKKMAQETLEIYNTQL